MVPIDLPWEIASTEKDQLSKEGLEICSFHMPESSILEIAGIMSPLKTADRVSQFKCVASYGEFVKKRVETAQSITDLL